MISTVIVFCICITFRSAFRMVRYTNCTVIYYQLLNRIPVSFLAVNINDPVSGYMRHIIICIFIIKCFFKVWITRRIFKIALIICSSCPCGKNI